MLLNRTAAIDQLNIFAHAGHVHTDGKPTIIEPIFVFIGLIALIGAVTVSTIVMCRSAAKESIQSKKK